MRLHLLENDFDHLIPNSRSLWKSRFEVFLDPLKAVTIGFKVAKRNTFGPSASSKGKLEVISSERVIFYSSRQDFVKKARLPKQVLGDAKPETEQL